MQEIRIDSRKVSIQEQFRISVGRAIGRVSNRASALGISNVQGDTR
jgi:hypothetical protein